MTVHGVEVEREESEVHPERVCNSCYVALSNHSKAVARGEVCADRTIQAWGPHTECCPVCQDAAVKSVGGRPRKRPVMGRPSSDHPQLIKRINTLDIPNLSDSNLDTSLILDSPFSLLGARSASIYPVGQYKSPPASISFVHPAFAERGVLVAHAMATSYRNTIFKHLVLLLCKC